MQSLIIQDTDINYKYYLFQYDQSYSFEIQTRNGYGIACAVWCVIIWVEHWHRYIYVVRLLHNVQLPPFYKRKKIYIYILHLHVFQILQQQWLIWGSKENIVDILDNKYYSVNMVDFI